MRPSAPRSCEGSSPASTSGSYAAPTSARLVIRTVSFDTVLAPAVDHDLERSR